MGDTTTAPATGATEQTTEPPATGTETTTVTDARLPEDHPVVLALKKANDEAAASRLRLKEIEDAEKSELEKANETAANETERANTLETELHQLRAALKHGLDLEDVDLLGTGTAEDIEARAKRLADRSTATKKNGNRAPREGLTQSNPAEDEMRAFTRNLFGKPD